MTEEFDRAHWTLPPVVPVLIALAIVAGAITLYTLHASRPTIAGKVLGVYAAAVPGDTRVLVEVQLEFQNLGKAPLVIRDTYVQVKPEGQKPGDAPLEDRASPVPDLERYFKAFPELATHQGPAFAPETRVNPGEKVQGLVLVAFPLSREEFDKRQWLHVVVEPYNHLPVTLTQ